MSGSSSSEPEVPWLALRRALGAGSRWRLAGAGALLLLASPAPGGEGPGTAALRAVAALGGLAILAGAGTGSRRPPAPSALSIEERHPLGRDVGVALVRCSGRRWLLGWGPRGVSVLAEAERDGHDP